MPACPALRPRWNLGARPSSAPQCCLPRSARRRRLPQLLPFRGSITQPTSSLSTPRARLSPLTTQDSLPAGGQPLPGGSAYPLGLAKRFPRCHPRSTSLPPSPGFTWRTAPRERARSAGSAVMSLRLALENENAESVFSIGCVPRRPHFHSRRAIEAASGRVARRCAAKRRPAQARATC